MEVELKTSTEFADIGIFVTWCCESNESIATVIIRLLVVIYVESKKSITTIDIKKLSTKVFWINQVNMYHRYWILYKRCNRAVCKIIHTQIISVQQNSVSPKKI